MMRLVPHPGSLLSLLLAACTAAAGPREALDVQRIFTPQPAHDVVEAARAGLTIALLSGQREPRVLRAERVDHDGAAPLWRVDVAGRSHREGCAAVSAWIAEDGRLVLLSQVAERAPGQDCSGWYFDWDALTIEAAKDETRASGERAVETSDGRTP